MYVAEFDKAIVEDTDVTSEKQKRDYTRGYFDADGSVPNDPEARFYTWHPRKRRLLREKVRSTP